MTNYIETESELAAKIHLSFSSVIYIFKITVTSDDRFFILPFFIKLNKKYDN